MRRLLAIIMLFACVGVACNNETPTPTPEDKGKVVIKSNPFIDFDAYGGNGEIVYEYEGSAATNIEAHCDADWVENLTVGETITFSVGYNNTSDVRSAWITVSCGKQNEAVVVTQQKGGAIDVEFTASYLNGTYFGRVESGFNYFVILSDVEAPYASAYLDRGVQYRLDLYSDIFGGFGKAPVPQGVYRYDGGNNYEPGSFADDFSEYDDYNGSALHTVRIVAGCIYVRERSIEAYLKLQNGEIHHVNYTGSLDLGYPGMDVPPYSLLPEDFTFEHNSAASDIRAMYFGDRFGVGYDNWTLELIETRTPYSGDYFIVSLLLPKTDMDLGILEGEYKIWSNDMSNDEYAYTFIPGSLLEGQPKYSWYMVCQNGMITGERGCPFVDGTIKVEKTGSKYCVTFDCIDDRGNKISGTFTSAMNEVYDRRDMQCIGRRCSVKSRTANGQVESPVRGSLYFAMRSLCAMSDYCFRDFVIDPRQANTKDIAIVLAYDSIINNY